MFSAPPATTMEAAPSRIFDAPRKIAWSPEPHAWFRVKAGFSCGIPDPIETCRAILGPTAAWRAQPKSVSSTSPGATPARWSAARTAWAPSCTAVVSAKEPRYLPIGVRTDARMATRSTRLLSVEARLPLFQEGLQPLAHVLGRRKEPERDRLLGEAVLQIGFEAANRGVHGEAKRDGTLRQHLPRNLLAVREEVGQREDRVHEPDPMGLLRVDHPAGADQLERAAEANQAREPLRAAVAGDDAEPDLGKSELRVF